MSGAGNDTIIGGDAPEILIGDGSPGFPGPTTATGAGNDTISGGGGGDLLLGDNSADAFTTLGPDGGNDSLDGGSGDDLLRAGPANDRLDGGLNSDDCEGETGIDTAKRCEFLVGIP